MTAWVDHLPAPVYSVAQVRELDRLAIEDYGIEGYELMCRAGRAAFSAIKARWPGAQRILIYCGAGNNAGDGYVLGRLASAAGCSVRLVAAIDPAKLGGDAAQAWRDCAAAGVAIEAAADAAFRPDLIVDGLLGTGLDRPVVGAIATFVQAINQADMPVLALDVPTGLDADTGQALGETIQADATITFVGLKQGLFLGAGPDHCGSLGFSGLGIPQAASAGLEPVMRRLGIEDMRRALPRRVRSAHKGDHGRLLLVGGAPGTAGAIRLAAEAALRVGAGLVYVATHPDSVPAIMAGRPELMCRAIQQADELEALIDMADAVVLGPGLGRTEWSRAVWGRIMNSALPLVADADALNIAAELGAVRVDWAITPHPGEAARLLGTDAGAVQADRLGSVAALARRYQAVTVLKGACTLVAAPGDTIRVCERGNPGMATGGTGDVLAGVIGGLLAQTGELELAVRAGVLLHALAGDDAAADGERGTLASDLMPHIRRWANPL